MTDTASREGADRRRVGPVLQAGEVGRAVALAIVELKPGAEALLVDVEAACTARSAALGVMPDAA